MRNDVMRIEKLVARMIIECGNDETGKLLSLMKICGSLDTYFGLSEYVTIKCIYMRAGDRNNGKC